MKQKFSVLAALCALFVLLFSTSETIGAAASGLRLCVELILPGLFPFFVISGLLSRVGFPRMAGRALAPAARRLFGVSGAGTTAFFIGITGGYPLGAAYLADLEEQRLISPGETGRLLVFCNNSGPAFLVGAIGAGIFRSTRIGLLLYLAHILAAVLAGLSSRWIGPKSVTASPALEKASPQTTVAASEGSSDGPLSPTGPMPLSRALPAAVQAAVSTALNVCGLVVCFAVCTGLLSSWGILGMAADALARCTGLGDRQALALLTGLFELGGGVGALRGLPPTPGNMALAAALVGWGGLSVHFQTLSVLADSEIKSSLHLAGRLMSAVFGAALAYGLGSMLL
ncbi:MAG: hypothetical protein IK095_09505 [Oscillospiraceae bacterium]|nr:hypothetical protein [Oscillospiraceae bacterium]